MLNVVQGKGTVSTTVLNADVLLMRNIKWSIFRLCSQWIREGNGNPLQYSCLEKSHGWRNLVGYSPWGHKGLDMA